MKINVYNQAAEVVKELEISDHIFAVKASNDLLHQAMVAQRANTRQVLAHTKDRSEVAGSGKKPWKQKGTGRARVGSVRSPLWKGGGVTFGPTKDRNFKTKINQKMKQKALLAALSDKAVSGTLVILDNLEFGAYKTKQFNALLGAIEKKVLKSERRDILVLNDAQNVKVKYSGRNLVGVKIINLDNLNLLDVLDYRNLLLTEDSVRALEKKYSRSAR